MNGCKRLRLVVPLGHNKENKIENGRKQSLNARWHSHGAWKWQGCCFHDADKL